MVAAGLRHVLPAIALHEVTIGKAKAAQRTAEPVVVDFDDVEARLKRHALHRRANPARRHPNGIWRQGYIVRRTSSADPDVARDRTVSIDAADARRALEARIGEYLTGHERFCLLRPHLPCLGRESERQSRQYQDLSHHGGTPHREFTKSYPSFLIDSLRKGHLLATVLTGNPNDN